MVNGLFKDIDNHCSGCNNYKGCVTCKNGEQWAHYEDATEIDALRTEYEKGKADVLMSLPVWRKSEPDIGQHYVLLFHGGGCIDTCDYRPIEKKFYYYDGSSYEDVSYNSDVLIGWMYVSELENLPKEE